jgi:hypothetical protein
MVTGKPVRLRGVEGLVHDHRAGANSVVLYDEKLRMQRLCFDCVRKAIVNMYRSSLGTERMLTG